MTLMALGLMLVATVQVICVLALVDQYKGLLQIRNQLEMVDTPKAFRIAQGVVASIAGLPREMDATERSVAVMLSTKCGTCRLIGQGFEGRLPNLTWAVLTGDSRETCEAWLTDVALSGDRVINDAGGLIARELDLRVFPSAVIFENGVAVKAYSVPSSRQLRRLIDGDRIDSATAGGEERVFP